MDQFWQTLKEMGAEFVQTGGLMIVRTIAFLVLGLVIVKIVQNVVRATALKSKLDKSASTFVVSVVTILLYIVLAVVLVSSLGFSTTGIIAAFSAVALAVALALKDSLASLANGVIIIFTKPFKKGDYIELNGIDGLVQDIRLFNTKIITYSNEEIIVPNSEILSSKLINNSSMPLRRVVIEVPIPYRSDVAQIKKLLLDGISSYKYVVKTPAPSVVLADYASRSLVFSTRAWTPNEYYWDTFFDLRDIIFNTLRENGIEMPFNRLDVTLLSDAEQGGKGADKK